MRKRAGILLLLLGCGLLLFSYAPKEAEEGRAVLSFLPDSRPALKDDFYAAVNYDMLREQKLPPDCSVWMPLTEMERKQKERLNEILTDWEKQENVSPVGSVSQKIGAYFRCALDERGRKKAGLTALQPLLAPVRMARTPDELLCAVMANWRHYGINLFWANWIEADRKDGVNHRVYMDGLPLRLPRPYYLEAANERYVEAYQEYLQVLFGKLGYEKKTAADAAQQCVSFERKLAETALNPEEESNPQKIYHPKTSGELQEIFSNVAINAALNCGGIGPGNGVQVWIVMNEAALRQLNSYLTAENLEFLKMFYQMRCLDLLADYTDEETEAAKWAFRNLMNGISESDSPEERAAEIVQQDFGMAFGKEYCKRYFSEESRKQVETMTHRILQAYETRMDAQEWMCEETKEKAKRKLRNMTVKVGCPEVWKDSTETVRILSPEEGGNLLLNKLALLSQAQTVRLQSLFLPVDREEWHMMPQTVNAYYDPSENEIVFPAGILQPPFFEQNGDPTKNLGGIGTVIGHEITHAFDAAGAFYDENGRYTFWWTDEEYAAFQAMQQEIISYYEAFEMADGIREDGRQTLSENIADLGSLSCVAELCGDDREALRTMFTQYAACWAAKMTQQEVKNRLASDVHSLPYLRVNAALRATDAYYEAFSIREGDGMYTAPEQRVRIW